MYPYSFAVEGDVRASDTPKHAEIDPAHVTADAEDDIDDCSVHGWLAGGYDCYGFSGDIGAFDIPQKYAEQYRVWLDGEEVRPHDLRTDTHPANIECPHGTGEQQVAQTTHDADDTDEAWLETTTQSPREPECDGEEFMHTLPCEVDCDRHAEMNHVLKLRSESPDCAWFRFKPTRAVSLHPHRRFGGIWTTISTLTNGRSKLAAVSFSGEIEYLELSNHDMQVKLDKGEWHSGDDFRD